MSILTAADFPSPEAILSEEFLSKYRGQEPTWGFNGLGKIVFLRTYARSLENGQMERWDQAIERCIRGAQKIGACYTIEEAEELYDLVFNLKCSFSGRSLHQLGGPLFDKTGLMDNLLNCWTTKVGEIEDFIFIIMESMFGGGVGTSVAKEFTYELPRVKNNVTITHIASNDADFIVPDSKEGWAELARQMLTSYLVTGKSFTWSSVCIRKKGSPIKTFGGTAPGADPLIKYSNDICAILSNRSGKKLRSEDVSDLITIGGFMVKSGGVRRTAILLAGDVDDMSYLHLKRWDLGAIPNHRSNSNNSLLCSKFNHLSPKFWDGYNGSGEANGLLNLPLARKFGRLGETSFDGFSLTNNAIIMFNPCVSDDTVVMTEDGPNQVKNLLGKKTTLVINSQEYPTTDSGFYQTGTDELFNLITKEGFSIKCTKNHKVLVSRNNKDLWIEAQHLQVNDKIHVSRNTNYYWQGRGSLEEGWLVGNLLGDGCICRDIGYLSYWGDNRAELRDSALEMLKKVDSNINPLSGTGDPESKAPAIRISSRYLKTLANSYGVFNNKEIDHTTECTSSDFYRGFLSGWFDADGTVIGNQVKGVSVRLSSIKLDNLKIAQRMLQKLGIYSVIYQERKAAGLKPMPDGKGGVKDYWCQTAHELMVSKESIVRFATMVGFVDKNKQSKLENLIAQYKQIYKNKWFARFESLTSLGNHAVYDCTVPDKECFDANGLIVHNCAEFTGEDKECCNLASLALNRLTSQKEMSRGACLLYKTCKAIAGGKYLYESTNKVVHKNMKIGLSVTGVCQRFTEFESWCDQTYRELRKFDKEWSAQRGWPQSIRLTVVQPEGTKGLMSGSKPGGHSGYSKYHIRRVRLDIKRPEEKSLVNALIAANYPVENELHYDNSINPDIMVASFPCTFEDDGPLAKDLSAVDQLEILKKLQTCWADQAVSITVYYKMQELPEIKKWLAENYDNCVKSVSFLLHSDHGFKQAPLEEITEDQYKEMVANLKPLDLSNVGSGVLEIESCATGACPVR